MENDIIERLEDLIEQATKERSHYYVKKCAQDALDEIIRLRMCINAAKAVLAF